MVVLGSAVRCELSMTVEAAVRTKPCGPSTVGTSVGCISMHLPRVMSCQSSPPNGPHGGPFYESPLLVKSWIGG
jgi:hypothetical protein